MKLVIDKRLLLWDMLRRSGRMPVLLCILLRSNDDGTFLETASYIVNITGINPITVQASIRDLCECNILSEQDGVIRIKSLPPGIDLSGKEKSEESKVKNERPPVRQRVTESKEKKAFGQYQNLQLTDAEIGKIKERVGDELETFLNFFSVKKKAKNYAYKSDYRAIVNWGYEAYYNSQQQHEQHQSTYQQQRNQARQLYAHAEAQGYVSADQLNGGDPLLLPE